VVATKLKKIADERGVKYVAIAKATSIPIDAISKSFNGKRQLLADELLLICRFMNISFSELASLTEEPQAT
jgi:transcriptional regulator with XRE-family HTH domain